MMKKWPKKFTLSKKGWCMFFKDFSDSMDLNTGDYGTHGLFL